MWCCYDWVIIYWSTKVFILFICMGTVLLDHDLTIPTRISVVEFINGWSTERIQRTQAYSNLVCTFKFREAHCFKFNGHNCQGSCNFFASINMTQWLVSNLSLLGVGCWQQENTTRFQWTSWYSILLWLLSRWKVGTLLWLWFQCTGRCTLYNIQNIIYSTCR